MTPTPPARDPIALEPLWSAAQARAADAYTIEDVGVPGIVLMEHAGKACADIARAFPGVARALVFAGPGNNGGDGWVIARHLWGAGIPCPVVTLRSPELLTGDASLAAQMFLTAAEARGWSCAPFGAPFFLVDLADDVEQLVGATQPDIVIDAIFGTGLSRALEGLAARVVAGLAQTRVPILAVDLPSGLPTDGAAPLGACVAAATTVTFGGRKVAHVAEPGRGLCGDVRVVDVGILYPQDPQPAAWRLLDARAAIPAAASDAHKNRYGHVGVVEGASPGAARLAARAALRAGAGLATVLVGEAHALPEPELMARVLPRGGDVERALFGISTLVCGPGLGHGSAERTGELLARAAKGGIPVVVDAEALDTLATSVPPGLAAVATPHPGEAARLLGVTSADVQRDRIAALRGMKHKLGPGVIVLLKGSCPCVIGDDGRVIVVEGGNPTLAVAGSGDVLAGAVGGLLARGLPPLHAALVAAAAHQRAGRTLGATGVRGHLASDIADALRAALL